MKIAVILRQVPDVVEELVIAADGRSLEEDDVMYVTNEGDDHALEQALLLKARCGGTVTAISTGGPEAKDALASAVAKGADEAIFVPIAFGERGDNVWLASRLAPALKSAGYDLILTGVWAADQRDAGLGGLLAAQLACPYVGGLTSLDADPAAGKATVRKEFAGGRLGVLEVGLPAVMGVQSAEQPPRYVPVSKVMQAKKALQAREIPAAPVHAGGIAVTRLMRPEASEKAEMIEGDVKHVADRITRILAERGIV